MIPGDVTPKEARPFSLLKYGLHGHAHSGKSTVAALLAQRGFTEIGFADPMKRFVGEIFGVEERLLWGPSELRNRPSPELGYATPRKALQLLGTEWARSFHPDAWINYLLRTADKIEEIQRTGWSVPVYNPKTGLSVAPGHGPIVRGVVVSDVRFQNEADLLRAAGYRILHMQRDAPPRQAESWQSHASEAGIPVEEGDLVLDNNGTLEELEERVQALVKE